MRRRTLLRRAAGATLPLALAGCASNPDTGAPDDETDTPGADETDTPGADETPTPTDEEPAGNGGVAVVDTTFDVGDAGSGTQTDRASVAFDPDANRVRVEGTIWGANGCKTAALGGTAYDEAADEVTVRVVTRDREGTGDRACTQAIVEIPYEAAVGFEGGLPASAVVVHDGRTVTSADR